MPVCIEVRGQPDQVVLYALDHGAARVGANSVWTAILRFVPTARPVLTLSIILSGGGKASEEQDRGTPSNTYISPTRQMCAARPLLQNVRRASMIWRGCLREGTSPGSSRGTSGTGGLQLVVNTRCEKVSKQILANSFRGCGYGCGYDLPQIERWSSVCVVWRAPSLMDYPPKGGQTRMDSLSEVSWA